MKLTVTGRHLVISPAERALIQSGVKHLDRILNDTAVSAHCVIAKEANQYVCELSLHARGDHMLHGVGRGRGLAPAVSAAVQKVERQGQRLTGRWLATRRKGEKRTTAAASKAALAMNNVDADVAAPSAPRVIRTRGYDVKPMGIDDAVLALTSGDRAFFVFRHASSESVAVVFRRPDGNIGLIELDA